VRLKTVVHGKCDSCHKPSELKANTPVCKMAGNGRLTVDQNVKDVLFYAETNNVVATQRLFVHTLLQGGLLANRQFTDFANNLKLMVLCWRRSGRVPPESEHLQTSKLFTWLWHTKSKQINKDGIWFVRNPSSVTAKNSSFRSSPFPIQNDSFA